MYGSVQHTYAPCWLLQEIGAFAWHFVHELPASVDEANQAYVASGGNRHRFFMVRWGLVWRLPLAAPLVPLALLG